MKIISDYEGSSIDILSYDVESNSVKLSLKKENDKYSQYYNFIVENTENKEGTIFIKNIKLSKYYEKNSIYLPYKKVSYDWEKISPDQFSVKDDTIEIIINPNERVEISLVPKYTQKELNEFMGTLKNYDFINIYQDLITKIEIGSTTFPTIFVIGRQHPGETLSSFFIEGMINSIIKNKLYNKYHFVFYPIVNTLGVKNGCHRYVNGIDFNRSWNISNPPEEIIYLKSELDLYKVKCFIDVHNDEITPINYIRANGNLPKKQFKNLNVLKSMGPLYRIIRGIIKQKKIIDVHSKTAREYVRKKYKCISILVELSMNEDYKGCEKIGYQFILDLLEYR